MTQWERNELSELYRKPRKDLTFLEYMRLLELSEQQWRETAAIHFYDTTTDSNAGAYAETK